MKMATALNPWRMFMTHACALAIAFLPPTAITTAHAGTIERIDGDLTTGKAPVMPAHETTTQRTWTQIVWNSDADRLARRTYTLKDPLGTLGHTITWNGDAGSRSADGKLSGNGTLTWRKAGSAAYDTSALIASYVGTMDNGAPEGLGTYTHNSGVAYSGTWTNGLMHGEGRLFLPNGDQYSGSFAQGRPDGSGIYIDATGALYDGSFVAGLREGSGTLYPARGKAFAAAWKSDQPVAETVRYLQPDELAYPQVTLAQYQSYDDIRIGVLVDRAFYAHVPEEQTGPVAYTAESKRDVLSIFPDDQRLMDAWRGKTSITMTDDEEWDYSNATKWTEERGTIPYSAGFLGRGSNHKPVPVVVELRNDSDQPLRIVNAFLDVADSATDRDPAVHMRYGYVGDCGLLIDFGAEFDAENYGWTAAENASIRYTFANDTTREFTREIGTIDPGAKIDLTDDLQAIGYPVESFRKGPLACPDFNFEACLAKAQADGKFGPLTGHVVSDAAHIRTPVTGTLDYDWRDAGGTVQRKSSPFEMKIVVGRMEFGAECGEGGSPQDRQAKPFAFELDKQNYRIMLPLRDDIPPGVTGRWRVRLEAPKSSNHDFFVVFELADGRQVASRPVEFLYFKPRVPDAG